MFSFEVAKPLKSFIGKVFAVQVEQNLWQTALLYNFSFSLYTSCLPVVQSYFETLIHVQFTDESSFAPVSISFLCDAL
jgi:hypothetical protein